ncbi:FHA domain-containing protein, partial [Lysobacter zhanggongensis]
GVGTTVPGAGDALAALPPANDDLGATTVRPVVPDFVLRCVAGSLFGRNVPVHGVVTFGRAPECTVTVEDAGLSRLHARLLPGDGQLVLEDMGSSNGSFVNGRRVVRTEVRAGDEIGLDTLRFRVVSNVRGEDPRRPIEDARRPGWVVPALLALVVVAVGIGAYALA